MRLSPKTLVVLIGPSGAGKSHWAAANFPPDTVVSSDALRALVGAGERDQRAGTDAFELLDLAVDRRLRRGLLTVIDTLGLDEARRSLWLEVARRHGFATCAVVFETAPDVCKTRNRSRPHPVPAKVLTSQIAARDALVMSGVEGFDAVEPPSAVSLAGFDGSSAPTALRFGLHLSSFTGPGPFADRLAEIVRVAEGVGFSSIWVMDHLMQIPQVGREWEDMPESWTTLSWIAAHTSTVRLGTLVSCVTFRSLAHLAKIVATADVLSGGRVICGLGLGWWEHEHRQYGFLYPPVGGRYELLEDALQLLPVMWGPGAPSFSGKTVSVPAAVCYPRPVQEHVPLLVGGSGEQRTLRLAAQYADACNLFGEPDMVRHKVSVLQSHCASFSREVQVTHLSTAVTASSSRALMADVARLAPGPPPHASLQRLGAGTVDDQIGRYSALADAGVETAIVALPDVGTPGCLETFGAVISAFGVPPRGW